MSISNIPNKVLYDSKLSYVSKILFISLFNNIDPTGKSTLNYKTLERLHNKISQSYLREALALLQEHDYINIIKYSNNYLNYIQVNLKSIL